MRSRWSGTSPLASCRSSSSCSATGREWEKNGDRGRNRIREGKRSCRSPSSHTSVFRQMRIPLDVQLTGETRGSVFPPTTVGKCGDHVLIELFILRFLLQCCGGSCLSCPLTWKPLLWLHNSSHSSSPLTPGWSDSEEGIRKQHRVGAANQTQPCRAAGPSALAVSPGTAPPGSASLLRFTPGRKFDLLDQQCCACPSTSLPLCQQLC